MQGNPLNKPRLRTEGDKITMLFERPPTQEEFDYWAAVLARAVSYGNAMTGENIYIIGWRSKKES